MFRFAIDRGGTFTDVYAECPDGSTRVLKLLSVDPAYSDAPREGIRRVLQPVLPCVWAMLLASLAATAEGLIPRAWVQFYQRALEPAAPVPTERIESIRMGTTVATNALLERKGEPMALVITKGFHDLLHIGNPARPGLFDLCIEMPDVL
jgi:5-oxoprolinase (ATP-hydrolysing)